MSDTVEVGKPRGGRISKSNWPKPRLINMQDIAEVSESVAPAVLWVFLPKERVSEIGDEISVANE